MAAFGAAVLRRGQASPWPLRDRRSAGTAPRHRRRSSRNHARLRRIDAASAADEMSVQIDGLGERLTHRRIIERRLSRRRSRSTRSRAAYAPEEILGALAALLGRLGEFGRLADQTVISPLSILHELGLRIGDQRELDLRQLGWLAPPELVALQRHRRLIARGVLRHLEDAGGDRRAPPLFAASEDVVLLQDAAREAGRAGQNGRIRAVAVNIDRVGVGRLRCPQAVRLRRS